MIYLYILIALLASGFFSAIEIAYVSADRLRIELDKSHKNWYASLQTLFFNNPGQFITTMLVGNNIALVIYGIYMAQLLEPFLSRYMGNPLMVVLVQTLFSTIVILFTAEFIPKAIAKLNPNWHMKTYAIPLAIAYFVLWPVAKFSAALSSLLLMIMGVKREDASVVKLGKIDLDNYIELNNPDEGDEHSKTEVKILQNAIEFADIKLRDCLVPRNEVVAVALDETKDNLMHLFIKTGFSKIIVYKETIDDIVGYIHSVEMFRHHDKWQDGVRSALFAPETVQAQKIMKDLMQHKKSIAVVVDELGGTAGIVTLEDLVEEIFGDIEDEHDTRHLVMKKTKNDEYLLSGRAEIDDINDEFDLDLPSLDDYITIAGLILHELQSLPSIGEEIYIMPRFKFTVVRASKNKIVLVRLQVQSVENEDPNPDDAQK